MPKLTLPGARLPDWDIARLKAGFALCERGGAFSFCDKAIAGVIATKELGTVLRTLDYSPTEAGLDEVLEEFDKDGRVTLDFEEFLSLMQRDPEWMRREGKALAVEEARSLRTQLDAEIAQTRELSNEEARKLRAELDAELAGTKARFDEAEEKAALLAAQVVAQDDPEEKDEIPVRNADDFISIEDLRECLRPVMAKFGEELGDDEVADALSVADVDSEGLVDYQEFVIKMMLKEPRNSIGGVAARFGFSAFIAQMKWTRRLRAASLTGNSSQRVPNLSQHVIDPQPFGHSSLTRTAVVAKWMDGFDD